MGRNCISLLTLLAALAAAPSVSAQMTWTQQSPATHPGPLLDPGMAYDTLHQRTVLFSGTLSNGSVATTPADTWLWDGQQANWTLAAPAHKPPGRVVFGIAYDELHGQTVIFGGATQNVYGDTWVWDGSDWTQKFPANSPSPRFATAMAYDAARQQVVLFGGGFANGSVSAETWVWDGNNWTQKISATNPDARLNHQMAYDSARKEVVLYGGNGNTYATQYSDTWVWDGSSWILRTPATHPQPLRFHAMAYDSARQQTVLFGGYNSGPIAETWFWDGVNWTQFAGPGPSARYDMGMAYDALSQRTVMFGGDTFFFPKGSTTSVSQETWTLGGGQGAVSIDVPAGVQFSFNGQNYAGSQTINIGEGSYTLSAPSPQAAGAGTQWVFSSWSDGGAQSHDVTVGAAAVKITGSFRTQYQMTTVALPNNEGSVAQSAGGSNGPFYDAGTQVLLTAAPAAGFGFAGWSGDCAGLAPTCTLMMNSAKSVTAAFSAGPFDVEISVPANIQFTLNGVSYTGTQNLSLAPGSYQLSIVPAQVIAPGQRLAFNEWTGGGAATETITVAGPMLITGFFHLQFALTTTASPIAGGIVFASDTWFAPGTTVAVQQIPSASYIFTGWSGGCVGAGACSVNLDQPASVTGNFTPLKYDLTINVPAGVRYSIGGFPLTGTQTIALLSGSYALALNSPQALGAGTQLTFVSWSDGGAASHAVSLGAANLTVTGRFKTQYLLSTTASPAAGGTVGGGAWYDAGTTVFPVAFAAPGYTFQFWSGACSGGGACAAVMTAPLSVTANFSLPLDWVQLFPPSAPPGRAGMVWDEARRQTVLFTEDGFTAETWIFDGANWTQKLPANSPAARQTAGFAYDSSASNGVLFGGVVGIEDQNDTWIWDGVNWTQKSPANSPAARDGHAMAYDAARRNTILFGGSDSQGAVFNDVWVWDGNNWSQKHPAHVPPAREFQTMAYDAARGVVVMFGGYDQRRNFLADTWIWDGTDWIAPAPLQSPPPRAEHVMTYDAAHQQVIMFGGTNSITELNDTWVWDGTNWQQRTPAHMPTPRSVAAMAFDALRQQPILFGGTDGGNARLNDTWAWITPAVNLVPQAPVAVNDGQGNYLITVTLKNQGNAPLTALTVSGAKLGGVAATGFAGGKFIAAIEPGATGSFTAVFPIASIAGKAASLSFQGFYSSINVLGAAWNVNVRTLNLP